MDISHGNYSLYIREVSSVSGWITDPLHPGFSVGLYSYTSSLLPQVCRYAPSQSQSGNWIIQKQVKTDAPNLFQWKFLWCLQLLPTVWTHFLFLQNTTAWVQTRISFAQKQCLFTIYLFLSNGHLKTCSICIITFENMPCPIGWLFQSCLSTRQSFNPVTAFRYANEICFAKRYLN